MRPAVGILVALFLLGPSAAGDDATILDRTGSGVVPVNDEKLVRIRGVEGEIILQGGEQGSIEFGSTSLGKSGETVPITLATDGAAFTLDPPAGQAIVKSRLRVVVPPGMRVLVEADNAAINAAQMDSDLAVRGSRLRLEASGMSRRVDAEITGGVVRVQGAAQGLALKGSDLEAVLAGISGPAVLRLTGGSARLSSLQAGLQGEFVRTRVGTDTILGPVDLRFQAGTAQLARLRDGGQIVAAGCRLVLSEIAGDLAVTSDSEVQFSDSRATIRIENTAGNVTGMRNEGVVEVTTHRAAVSLTQIGGRLNVSGDGLDVKLQDIGASIAVVTHGSNIFVEGSSSVNIDNNGGDVTVKRSEALIEVKSRNGRVHLLEMRGPVNVDAAGELVEVEFLALSQEQDSRILNDGGAVTVRFIGGDSRIEAVSRFGRVESFLPGVKAGKDDTSAQGVVGGGSSRTLIVKASGDVQLVGPEGAVQTGQTP